MASTSHYHPPGMREAIASRRRGGADVDPSVLTKPTYRESSW
jgi:hypothetical protein